MAVDPLNPASPVKNDPVEVSAELRAIKGVLVPVKESAEASATKLTGITAFSAFGKSFVQAANADAGLTLLNPTNTGKEIFRIENYAALAAALQVANPNVGIITGGVGVAAAIFPGGLKANFIYGAYADQYSHTFAAPFSQRILGVAATLMQDENTDLQCYNETLSGITVSFGGSGTKKYSVIVFGQ